MKWSFYSAGMVMFGLVGMGIIVLFIQLTVNSDEEYYLLKEVTEASMMDSIDITYYRNTGNIKIIKEKFAQSTNNNANSYQIKISNIVESPPKVSVEITSELGKRTIFKSRDDYNVYSDLDAIIEFNK